MDEIDNGQLSLNFDQATKPDIEALNIENKALMAKINGAIADINGGNDVLINKILKAAEDLKAAFGIPVPAPTL